MTGFIADVARILTGHPTGLTIRELLEQLRASGPAYVLTPAERVERLLTQHDDLVQRDDTGRWGLRVARAHEEALRALDDAALTRLNVPPALRDKDIVIVDIEATTNDPTDAEILQVAAVRLSSSLAVRARFTECYVKPSSPITPDITRLTGITDDDVRDAAGPDVVLAAFDDFAHGAYLVAHNGSRFDGPVLQRIAAGLGRVWEYPVADSLIAAAIVLPQLPSRAQKALCAHFCIPVEVAHRAGADVDALVEIVRHLRRCVEAFPRALQHALARVLGPASREAALLGLPTYPEDGQSWEDVLLALVPDNGADSEDGPLPAADGPLSSSDAIARLFAADGPIARQVESGYEERPGQTEMAVQVWDALRNGAIAMVEAGTGTGKTRAYLGPSIRWAAENHGPVIVSTHTKTLQNQIITELDLLAQAEGLAPRQWRYAVLKGRSNYLCLHKLANLLEEINDLTPYVRRVALAMRLVWAREAQRGTEDEFALGQIGQEHDIFGQARAILPGSRCDEDCAERRCPLYAPCYYFRARRRAARADVTVVNHALLLSPSPVVAGYRHIIIDEAHTLEDAATESLTATVSGSSIQADLNYISRIEGRAVDGHGSTGLRVRLARAFGLSLRDEPMQQLATTIEESQAALKAASLALHTFLREQDHKGPEEAQYPHSFAYEPHTRTRPWLRTTEVVRALAMAVRGVVNALNQVAEEIDDRPVRDPHYSRDALWAELRCVRTRLVDAACTLQSMIALEDRHNAVYLLKAPVLLRGQEVDGEAVQCKPSWSFHAVPIAVRDALGEVFRVSAATVLTSATLTIEGSFDFMRGRLGTDIQPDRLRLVTVPSPFDYQAQCLLALPAHLPSPRASIMEEYLERLAQDLVRYAHVFDGRTMALFTARAHIQTVAALVSEQLAALGLALYAQGGHTQPTALQAEFLQEPRGLLLGAGAFWAGIDIPTDALSHVWITKLPFQNMSDPLLKARQKRLIEEDPAANPFDDYLLPLTVLQFKQGFGRLIRTKSDRGAVVVADRRLRTSMYRDVFLNSLPGSRQTEASDVAMYREIAEFLGWPLDEELLRALPPTPIEQIIAQHLLSPADDDAVCARKLTAALLLFQLSPPKITAFHNKQLEIMLAALCGDTLAILPTGAGKSLCFQLPALLRKGVTVVVSPLVALMKDQVDKLRRERGIHKVRAIVYSVTRSEQEEIMQDIQAGRCSLLYLAPERLRDQGTVAWLRTLGVVQLVVDEAHCVSLWGPTFRPEYLAIREVIEHLGRPLVLALTATATPLVRDDIIEKLGLGHGHPHLFTVPFDRPNLIFGVTRLPSRRAKDRELLRMIGAIGRDEAAIVYVARKRDAERLAWLIETYCSRPAHAYHAGMSVSLRASIQEAFTEQGGEKLQVIVATKAFGMGIDKRDVRYVIHYDMPDSIESYYQEAGRAGRDNQAAYCMLLYTPRDRRIQEFFIRMSAPDTARVRTIYACLTDQPDEASGDGAGRSRGAPRRRRQLARPPVLRVGNRVYLNVSEVAAAMDVSESTVRIILYHLEQHSFIRREMFDYGARARLKILCPPDEIAAHIAADPEMSESMCLLAQRAVDALGFIGPGTRDVETRVLADKLGVSPVDIEGVFLHMARWPDQRVVYRSWDRGVVITVSDTAPPPHAFMEDMFTEQRAQGRARLDAMRRYVGASTCRRHIMLEHLGDATSGQNCRACDACVADIPWPWATAAAPPPRLDGAIDPEWELLRAIAWSRGRYAAKQIELALRGQDHYGPGRIWEINKRLIAADFFGRLQYIRLPRMQAALRALREDGLIISGENPGNGTGRPYAVYLLTERGLQACRDRRIPVPDASPSADGAQAAHMSEDMPASAGLDGADG